MLQTCFVNFLFYYRLKSHYVLIKNYAFEVNTDLEKYPNERSIL